MIGFDGGVLMSLMVVMGFDGGGGNFFEDGGCMDYGRDESDEGKKEKKKLERKRSSEKKIIKNRIEHESRTIDVE